MEIHIRFLDRPSISCGRQIVQEGKEEDNSMICKTQKRQFGWKWKKSYFQPNCTQILNISYLVKLYTSNLSPVTSCIQFLTSF